VSPPSVGGTAHFGQPLEVAGTKPRGSQVGKNDNDAMEDFPEHLRCCLKDAKILGCTVENSYPYVLRVETFSVEDTKRLRVCCALFGIPTRVPSHDSLVVLIIDD
jgi:hypothetical protein